MGGTCTGRARSVFCARADECARVDPTNNPQWQMNLSPQGSHHQRGCIVRLFTAGWSSMAEGGNIRARVHFMAPSEDAVNKGPGEEIAAFHVFLCKVLLSKCGRYISKRETRGCSFQQGLNLDGRKEGSIRVFHSKVHL